MKAVCLVFFTLVLCSTSASAAKIKTVSGVKALTLGTALFNSGVPFKDTDDGFKTISATNILCTTSGEHRISGGILRQTTCEAMSEKITSRPGFGRGLGLKEASALSAALGGAGADADAAMGTIYIYADQVSCDFSFDSHEMICTLETTY